MLATAATRGGGVPRPVLGAAELEGVRVQSLSRRARLDADGRRRSTCDFDGLRGTTHARHRLRPRRRRCDGVSRRDFLRVGALGASAACPACSQARARRAQGGDRGPKSVILVYLGGGLSHHDSFDPKPDAPTRSAASTRRSPPTSPACSVGELLPQMAKMMDKVAPRPLRGAQQRPPRDGHQLGPVRPLRLGVRRLPGDRRGRRARDRLHAARCRPTSPCRGTRRSPGSWARARSSAGATSRSRPATRTQPNFKVQDLAPAEALTAKRPSAARRCCTAVDGAGRARSRATTRSRPTTSSTQRGRDDGPVDARPGARSPSTQETDELRDRYGRNTFGQCACWPAGWSSAACGSSPSTTAAGTTTPRSSGRPRQEAARVRRGLLGADRGPGRRAACSTTRWWSCMGEFGRTPKINKDAGRDHWAPAGVAAVRRGGRAGRAACSARPTSRARTSTQPAGRARRTWRTRSTTRWASTRASSSRTPDGRPIEILDQGELVKELF